MRLILEFTDDEINKIRENAANSGVMVSTYIKHCALEGLTFESGPEKLTLNQCFEIIKNRLNTLSAGRFFFLPDLLGPEWHLLEDTEKKSLGKQFYHKVLDYEIENVKFIDKKRGQKAKYMKV